jgi:acyl-CoA reductase-like NAD-dependent aldehyde dehydrogenase
VTRPDEVLHGVPDDVPYDRNLIAGMWRFPAMPYDFEIRSPLDSSVLATVPLSSRLDVDRAVLAARAAAADWHSCGTATRLDLLRRVVAELHDRRGLLAPLLAAETGLEPADAATAVDDVLRWADVTGEVDETGETGEAPAPGVSGHVLSWGLPFGEVVTSLLPQLARGYAVVAKPSLRTPLSAAAFAHAAVSAGLPPGVLNIVQGTGLDVGAALLANPHLARLEVRGNHRTRTAAHRAAARRNVEYCTLTAGGNIAIIGEDADEHHVATQIAPRIADAVRVHSAGGPLAIPVLAVHAAVADTVIRAVLHAVADIRPAPLPTQVLRDRALDAVRRSGASLLCGGHLPDDATHRMGWTFPATVLLTGNISRLDSFDAGEPLGPVLRVVTWETGDELVAGLGHPRHRDGIACLWGLGDDLASALGAPHRGETVTRVPPRRRAAPRRAGPPGPLPHRVIVRDAGPRAALRGGALPSTSVVARRGGNAGG